MEVSVYNVKCFNLFLSCDILCQIYGIRFLMHLQRLLCSLECAAAMQDNLAIRYPAEKGRKPTFPIV